MVQTSPRVSFGFPSTISSFLTFTSRTFFLRRKSRACCTFASRWNRMRPVSRGCKGQRIIIHRKQSILDTLPLLNSYDRIETCNNMHMRTTASSENYKTNGNKIKQSKYFRTKYKIFKSTYCRSKQI